MKICGIKVAELTKKYGTPLYVYDFNKLHEKAQQLKNAFASSSVEVDIYYAMKANCHPAIIRLLCGLGFGMDCVSPGEVELALRNGVMADKLLYSANYEGPAELKLAQKRGVKINLDDITSLDRMLKSGTPEIVSFRMNPGRGKGKFEEITTAGEKAKFGVPYEDTILAYKKAQESGIKKFGAHMMTGSGILEDAYFIVMLGVFLEELKNIHDALGIEFDFIDMGGGFGIPYFDDNKSLNIEKLGKSITKLFREKVDEYKLGNPSLALEPGRFLAADSGYLLTTVRGIKKSYRKYIGVDAGFNTLIRPALYHAHHNIIIDGKENPEELEVVDVCGPICENTDIFARDRKLPRVNEGDLMIITQAGAYGNVMAMPYNLRFRPAEVAISDGKDFQITRRETIEDYLSRISNIPE